MMGEEQLKEQIMKVIQGILLEEPTTATVVTSSVGIFPTVDEAVAAAKVAQDRLDDLSLEQRRAIIAAIRTGMTPHIETIARETVEETKMGRYEDKIQKLTLAINKTPGVEDLITEAVTGDNGMTLYELSPYGVIGAVTPSTNPAETLICNAIGMIAAGNAIYFSVHPGAKRISGWVVSKLNELIYQSCGIHNLVVTIEKPSIEAAQEMMSHPDISLLVITGGPGVVRQAMKSGKKTIAAGEGNPPSLVDETADLDKAAADIVLGASFDNNILCTAEKSVVAVEQVVDYLILQMEKQGAYYIGDEQIIQRLIDQMIAENGAPNRQFVGKNASEILAAVGVHVSADIRVIIMKTEKDHPFVVKEMLMPILPIVTVKDFDEALPTALGIENKCHHTATMHSQNIQRLNLAAKKFQTSIFVKNGSSFAGLGFGGEGPTTFTIATPTGECTTTARNFARKRRCVLTDGFSIR